MSKIPETVEYEITKLWFAQQDLKNVTPAYAKQLFFDAFRIIEKTIVERWD